MLEGIATDRNLNAGRAEFLSFVTDYPMLQEYAGQALAIEVREGYKQLQSQADKELEAVLNSGLVAALVSVGEWDAAHGHIASAAVTVVAAVAAAAVTGGVAAAGAGAAVEALGGSGLAVSVAGGAAAGFVGSAAAQWITTGGVDWGSAVASGALGGLLGGGLNVAATAFRGARAATEGVAAVGSGGTTTLYRGVGQSELNDVLRFGDYGLSPSGGGKYFSLSRGGAQDFMNSSFNAGRNMTLTSIDVPSGMLQRGFSFFDTGGAGASIHFADEVLPDLYQSAGLPNILAAPWVPTIDRALVP
jgi:hypothetical protein